MADGALQRRVIGQALFLASDLPQCMRRSVPLGFEFIEGFVLGEFEGFRLAFDNASPISASNSQPFLIIDELAVLSKTAANPLMASLSFETRISGELTTAKPLLRSVTKYLDAMPACIIASMIIFIPVSYPRV